MRRALWLLTACAAVLVSSCAPPPPVIGGKDRTKRYEKVVSLSPSTTELIGTNNGQILKGRTEACNFPNMITSLPVVATVKPDYEKLAMIKPDLIVYDAALYNAADIEKLKQLGADTFAISATTVEEYITQIYELGSMIASETNVTSYADKVLDARTAALGDPIEPKPRVVLMLAGRGGEHMIAGTKSLQADAIRAAGGDLIGPDSDKFEPANIEFLVQQKPTLLIVAIEAPKGEDPPPAKDPNIEAVKNDPRLKSLPAVQTGAIVGMNQDVITRRGARVDKLIESAHKAMQLTTKK